MATTPRRRAHEHGDGQDHGHAHTSEVAPGPSDAGSVVLDIGTGAGAVVILTPVDMNGLEIEYRAIGDPWEEKHMAVRERLGPSTIHYAAIFGPLAPGVYEFRLRGKDQVQQLVTVAEGSVQSASWPTMDHKAEDGLPRADSDGLAVGSVPGPSLR
jgi:hypothetical protein